MSAPGSPRSLAACEIGSARLPYAPGMAAGPWVFANGVVASAVNEVWDRHLAAAHAVRSFVPTARPGFAIAGAHIEINVIAVARRIGPSRWIRGLRGYRIRRATCRRTCGSTRRGRINRLPHPG